MVGSGKNKPKWIQHARESMKRRGTEGVFSAKAQRAGMSTSEYADKVLAEGSHASAATRKQANFARNV